jgi:nitrite reductase/ring-hydroxylating ferredoxin subunit
MRLMTASAEWRCPTAAVPVGTTAKFRLRCDGRALDAFVVHHGGGYAAYVNRCPHVGTPLDLWPNEFLDAEGREFVCATHGATFEPASGLCTGGPCLGDRLTPLPARVDGDTLIVRCP